MARKPDPTLKFNLRDAKVLSREDVQVPDGKPPRMRLRKEAARVGVYHKAGGVTVPITRERIQHWENQFNRMRESKVAVPVTSDHSLRAKDKRGDVLALKADGDSLIFECEVIGKDAIEEALRNQCSIGIGDITGGDGSEFEDAIEHIALTPVPVIGGLGDWQRLSRSIPKDTAEYLSNGVDSMEAYKQVCKLLGITITDDMTEDQVFAAIKAWAATNKGEGAGKGGTVSPTGSGGGSGLVGGGVVGGSGMSREVERLTEELARVKAENQRPAVDEDALEMMAKATLSRLDALIPAGKLTKACRDKLEPVLTGSAGKRPAMALSRKAATFAGLSEPLAETILAALELNDPIQLAETTRHAGRTMSREVPGGDRDKEEDDANKVIQKAIEMSRKKHEKAA